MISDFVFVKIYESSAEGEENQNIFPIIYE